MRLSVLAAAVLLAGLAAGALLGLVARRRAEAACPEGAVRRAAPVESAWRALERGEGALLDAALAEAAAAVGLSPEDRLDLRYLAVLAAADEALLERLLGEAPDARAAGYARWALVRWAPTAEEGARRRAAFAARHPGAWVLREGAAR